jgi:hypothetical protein
MHGVVSETVDTRWNWHRTRDAGALMHSACKSRMVPELRAGSHRPGTQTHERCRSLTGRCFGPYAVVSSCPQQQQRRCFFLSSAAAAAPLFLLVLSSSSAVVSSCPRLIHASASFTRAGSSSIARNFLGLGCLPFRHRVAFAFFFSQSNSVTYGKAHIRCTSV